MSITELPTIANWHDISLADLQGPEILRAHKSPATTWPQRGFRERVDAIGRCGNRRPRVQKLVSAWNQGFRDDAV